MAADSTRSALVTGGGRGIGRDIALELARRGVQVAVVARSADEVNAVAQTIRDSGGTALGIAADVGRFESVARAVEEAEQRLGRLSILVNNAAIVGPLGPTATVDAAEWAQTINVNLLGAFYTTRLVLPSMLEQGWGRIINVSSGAAQGNGIVRGSAYSVSKAGLDMLTRTVAAEVTGSDIAAITVYPGVVDTAMQTTIRTTPAAQLGETTSARFQAYYEQGDLLDPTVPARLIAVLCGAAGSGYHGQTVRINDAAAQQLLADDAATGQV